jgi:hypothetical protein
MLRTTVTITAAKILWKHSFILFELKPVSPNYTKEIIFSPIIRSQIG